MRKACAFARRMLVRRFHIFIFQWRLRAGAGVGLRLLGIVMVRRHPGPPWLVHLVWLIPGTDLRGNGVQFAVDAMPLVVGVGSQIHLGRGRPPLGCDGAGSCSTSVMFEFGMYGVVSYPYANGNPHRQE